MASGSGPHRLGRSPTAEAFATEGGARTPRASPPAMAMDGLSPRLRAIVAGDDELARSLVELDITNSSDLAFTFYADDVGHMLVVFLSNES